MNDRINKTSICSIVFLDIIDYSKKTDSEQIEIKNQFNDLISNALKDVAENDRIILDTGDGAAIATGGSPEDILFIALNIRDEILKNNTLIKNNTHSAAPLYVRFGVNLGPVRVVKDINDRPNIIGDGINVAQRIMSFARPNEILVSRSYYEITSRLTHEIAQMFDYSGIKQDKHVREHEVYSVRSQKEGLESLVFNQTSTLAEPQHAIKTPLAAKTMNWKYAALASPAIVTFFLMMKPFAEPATPKVGLQQTAAISQNAQLNHAQVNHTQAKPAATEKTAPIQIDAALKPSDLLLPNESIATLPLANNAPTNTTKAPVKTDVALADKTPQELLELEKAKKKAKLAKKKLQEDALKNATDKKAQYGSVHNEPFANAKNEAAISKLKDNASQQTKAKEEGEKNCSQAQAAMHQC